MEDLEPKIKDCLKILQSTDEEKFSILYKRELEKLILLVYPYIQVNKEKYNVEIFETINNCIKNYKPDKGDFLRYFTSALKQNLAHLKANELLDEHTKGMHIPETAKRNFKKYKKSQGRDPESPEFKKKWKELTSKDIEDAEYIEYNCKTQSSIYQQEDEKNYDIFEETSNSEESCLDKMIFQENAQENAQEKITKITKIRDVFDSCRKDQKPILKVLLTSWLSLFITLKIPECCSHFQNQSFFDNETYQECIKNKKEMTHREIATQFLRSEQSVSRTWSNFVEKLEEKLDIKREK